MALRFTVGHTTGGGNQFTVTESITNATGIDRRDFHVWLFGTGALGLLGMTRRCRGSRA